MGNPANTTWSLINKTGGAVDSDLGATSGTGVTMTGRLTGSAVIRAVNGTLTPGDSGVITVIPGAVDRLQINTQPASALSVEFPFNIAAVVMAYDAGNNPTRASIVADRDPATGIGNLRVLVKLQLT
jgi:hypothetical protein